MNKIEDFFQANTLTGTISSMEICCCQERCYVNSKQFYINKSNKSEGQVKTIEKKKKESQEIKE